MTRFVVLGAGSVGCYLGGLLAKGLEAGSAHSISFIGRERYQTAIAAQGLRLTHMSRPEIYLPQIDFQTDPSGLVGADMILLCVKSQDTEAAALQIKAQAPDAQVVSFQNGVRNSQILREHLPADQVFPAIVPFNITPIGEGRFHCGVTGDLVLPRRSELELLREGFAQVGQAVRFSDNMEGDQWAKMIINLNNALNMLSGGPLRAGLIQRDYRRAFARSIAEALAVAKAAGIEVGEYNGRAPSFVGQTLGWPNFAYRLLMRFIVKIDSQARSSMLDDLEAGRGSEIDYLQGEIVLQAADCGVDTPCNSAVLDAAKAAFAAGKSPKMSGAEILALMP